MCTCCLILIILTSASVGVAIGVGISTTEKQKETKITGTKIAEMDEDGMMYFNASQPIELRDEENE